MTDRPRVWTLGLESAFDPSVDVIEWDREKVVPVIEAALARYQRSAIPRERSVKDCARFIFDALDPEGP